VCQPLEGRALLSSSGVLLNELWPTPYPARYPNQYVEITGPAGQSLAGVQFVQFDGFGNGSPTGQATYVKDLGSYHLGSNGLLIIEADTGGPIPLDPNTTVVTDPGFDLISSPPFPPGLNGGTNTYDLIDYSAGSKIVLNTMYDPSNTGTLTLPAGDVVVDGVSFVYHSSPSTTDRAYAPAAYLPVSSGVTPAAATRILGNTSANTASAWYYGFTLPNSRMYDPANANNLPANGGELTPGGANGPVFQFGDPTYKVMEPSGTTHIGVKVKVTRVNGFGSAGQGVKYTTLDESAVAGTDYTKAAAKVTFSPTSADSKTITITILSDPSSSSNTQFSVQLYAAQGGSIGQPSQTFVTILNTVPAAAAPAQGRVDPVVDQAASDLTKLAPTTSGWIAPDLPKVPFAPGRGYVRQLSPSALLDQDLASAF
jgi:hypothetical protein